MSQCDVWNETEMRQMFNENVSHLFCHLNEPVEGQRPQFTGCTERTTQFLLLGWPVNSVRWQTLVRPFLLEQPQLVAYLFKELGMDTTTHLESIRNIMANCEQFVGFTEQPLLNNPKALALCLGLGDTTELINILFDGIKRALKEEQSLDNSLKLLLAVSPLLEGWPHGRLSIFKRLLSSTLYNKQCETTLNVIMAFIQDDGTLDILADVLRQSQTIRPDASVYESFIKYTQKFRLDMEELQLAICERLKILEGPPVTNPIPRPSNQCWNLIKKTLSQSDGEQFEKYRLTTWTDVRRILLKDNNDPLRRLAALTMAVDYLQTNPQMFCGPLVRLNVFNESLVLKNPSLTNAIHALVKEACKVAQNRNLVPVPPRQFSLRDQLMTMKNHSTAVADAYVDQMAQQLNEQHSPPSFPDYLLQWKEIRYLIWLKSRPICQFAVDVETCCIQCTMLNNWANEFVHRFQCPLSRARSLICWLFGEPMHKLEKSPPTKRTRYEKENDTVQKEKEKEEDQLQRPLECKEYLRLWWKHPLNEKEIGAIVQYCRPLLESTLALIEKQKWQSTYERLFTVGLIEQLASDRVVVPIGYRLVDVAPLDVQTLHGILCSAIEQSEAVPDLKRTLIVASTELSSTGMPLTLLWRQDIDQLWTETCNICFSATTTTTGLFSYSKMLPRWSETAEEQTCMRMRPQTTTTNRLLVSLIMADIDAQSRYSEKKKNNNDHSTLHQLPIVYNCVEQNQNASVSVCVQCQMVCCKLRRHQICEQCKLAICSNCQKKKKKKESNNCPFCTLLLSTNKWSPPAIVWSELLRNNCEDPFGYLKVWDYEQLPGQAPFSVVLEAHVLLAMAAWSWNTGRKEVCGDFYTTQLDGSPLHVDQFMPLDNVNKDNDSFSTDSGQKSQAKRLMNGEVAAVTNNRQHYCAGTFHSHPASTNLLPTVKDVGGHLCHLKLGIIFHAISGPATLDKCASFSDVMERLCQRVLLIHVPPVNRAKQTFSMCPMRLPGRVQWQSPQNALAKAQDIFNVFQQKMPLPEEGNKTNRQRRLTQANLFLKIVSEKVQ